MAIYSTIDRFRDALAALGAETAFRYVSREMVDVIHEEMIAQYGGASGLRDENLLESALSRPLQLAAYEKSSDQYDMAFKLAASLCAGITRNHPFLDGNKRTAFVATNVFLDMNGLRLECDDAEILDTMMSFASGTIDDDRFADWMKRHSHPVEIESAPDAAAPRERG